MGNRLAVPVVDFNMLPPPSCDFHRKRLQQ